MMEDYSFDGVQPENDIPEDTDINRQELRYKALLLLLIFLVPTILITIELVTGSLSGWWVDKIQPHLPQLKSIVNF